jgi:OmcA/MtrC family decaheme c-type cytochrome
MKIQFKQAGAFLLAGMIAVTGCSGERGPAGTNGTNGTSCSAQSNGDGTATISCSDGTSATVADGTDGTNGTSCGVADNGNGTRTITCGTSTVTVSDVIVDFSKMSVTEKAEANMSIVVTDFSVPADGKPVITFKVSDRKGNGVKGLSTAVPASISYRIGLLKLAAGVNGSANDTWVNYNADNATSTASAETANGVSNGKPSGGPLTDNGDGTYTYQDLRVVTGASAKAATTYDPAAVHRVVVIMSASGNPFAPVNAVRDFVPNAFATDLTGQNEKVDPTSCLECHTRFRANANGTGAAFHGGVRYDVRTCVACHNDQQRFTTLSATTVSDAAIQADGTWTGNLAILNGESTFNLPVFIHKIHMGEDLTVRGGTYRAVPMPYEVTYPQDVRNCAKCHRTVATVAKAGNWSAQPSRRACGACHDGKTFLTGVVNGRTLHTGGAQADDSACGLCHNAAKVAGYHAPVKPPDTTASFFTGSTASADGRKNAAYVAAANVVPAGAAVIAYDVKSVSRDAAKHPVIEFRFTKNGTAVVFNTYAAGTVTEMMDGFVGSPSVQFAFAVPQDGIATPADFNASASAFIRAVWNGSNTNATMTFDAASGYYTLTINNVTIPDTATMLTGGIGYSYSISNRDDDLKRNMPLTQIDLLAFPYDSSNKTGGLIVPVLDIAKAATSDANTPASMVAARRVIVETAKCNACHGFLGVNPTFHIGQRNDAPTCSFCHTPNQTSSAWSAGSKEFVHGIHGASKRTVPFNWHAATSTSGYYAVTYPGLLNNCESCHRSGTYDYSSGSAQTALTNSTPTTVGQGRYNSNAATNPTGYFSISPYVTSDNSIDYGYGFASGNVTVTLPDGISGTQGGNACTPASPCTCTTANPCSVTVGTNYTAYNVAATVKQGTTTVCTDAAPCTCTTAATCTATVATCTTSAPCNAQGTTLVISPTVIVCSACHDSPAAISHMENDGFGSFYKPRSEVLAKQEYCLDCHGPGSILSIKNVHSQP